MTAVHIDDADILRLNGRFDEETMTKLINATPGEGGAIPGSFRTACIRGEYGWYLAGLMDCECEQTDEEIAA